MSETVNWKFSDENLNLLNSKGRVKDGNEMFEIIDSSKKEELEKIFETAISVKYDMYKIYLYENNLFLFRSLENNIKESVYCLIIDAYIASITNTNLILERAIKLALIQYHAEYLLDYSDEVIIQKYIESDKKYSGKNLDQNIQTCQKFNIFTENEAKELKEYKIKFRDGFSHFTPKNILKGEQSMFSKSDNLNDKKINMFNSLPNYQAVEVMQFAKNEAENHLKYVLKIINHLQFSILNRFRKK